ncbi:hypothetical protein [Devosia sp. XK-2]|uniref:hypothetical protein n=1 Tax=Devosia sp. XK-2 TaxID=3126689 RepID=UPI0030CD73CE
MRKKTAENPGKWMRRLGFANVELRPSHRWRHRSKMVARRVWMDSGAREYIRDPAEYIDAKGYGDRLAPALTKQPALIPALILCF